MMEEIEGRQSQPEADWTNSIKDINTHCMQEFQAHVDCLENNNQTFFNCRRPEQKLNSCIFDKLVCSIIQHKPPSFNCETLHSYQ
jgi:hypothetical protein